MDSGWATVADVCKTFCKTQGKQCDALTRAAKYCILANLFGLRECVLDPPTGWLILRSLLEVSRPAAAFAPSGSIAPPIVRGIFSVFRIGGRRRWTSARLFIIADRSCMLIPRCQPTQIYGVKSRAVCSGAVSAPAPPVTCIRFRQGTSPDNKRYLHQPAVGRSEPGRRKGTLAVRYVLYGIPLRHKIQDDLRAYSRAFYSLYLCI